jgi:D-alanyl-D-alanine carboxypeptidase
MQTCLDIINRAPMGSLNTGFLITIVLLFMKGDTRLNRKVLIIIITAVLSVTLISGIVIIAVSRSNIHSDAKTTDSSGTTDGKDITHTTPDPGKINEVTLSPQEQQEVDKEIADFVPATKMDLDPASITVFVNKEHALPKTYKPQSLVTPYVHFSTTYQDEKTLMRPEAANALEKLFEAAAKDGYQLTGVSAYRSYYRQYKIFRNNIITQGKVHTLKYSAVPGTSEHQTGLSIDISTESMNNQLYDNFADTPEGLWVAKNAHLFGFIIRYPKDKADITGYAYEPWHIRFVGRGLAYYLFEHNLTLDEYYHYTPDPKFNFEKVYADLINYTPPTPTPTMPPTPTLMLDANGNPINPLTVVPTVPVVNPNPTTPPLAPTPTPIPVPPANITPVAPPPATNTGAVVQ